MQTEQQSNLAYFLVEFKASDVSQVDFLLPLASKISNDRSWGLTSTYFYESRKSLGLLRLVYMLQIWIKSNLLFYRLFLTIDMELFIPSTGTPSLWMLFPSFLPLISFIWDFLWSPHSPFPGLVSCFRICHVPAPFLCTQFCSLGG